MKEFRWIRILLNSGHLPRAHLSSWSSARRPTSLPNWHLELELARLGWRIECGHFGPSLIFIMLIKLTEWNIDKIAYRYQGHQGERKDSQELHGGAAGSYKPTAYRLPSFVLYYYLVLSITLPFGFDSIWTLGLTWQCLYLLDRANNAAFASSKITDFHQQH